jgi:hypothetical protein
VDVFIGVTEIQAQSDATAKAFERAEDQFGCEGDKVSFF